MWSVSADVPRELIMLAAMQYGWLVPVRKERNGGALHIREGIAVSSYASQAKTSTR